MRLITTGLLIFLYSQIIIAQDLSFGLLLDYKFNNNYSDSSTNGFDAVNYGTTFSPDRFGNDNGAIFFDGNDFVEFPNEDQLKPNFPFTISSWFLLDELNDDSPIFNTCFENNFYHGAWLNIFPPDNPRIGLNYGDGGPTTSSNRRSIRAVKKIDLEEWVHVVAIYESPTIMQIYTNGFLQSITSSGSGAQVISYINKPGNLGRHDSNTGVDISGYLKGYIDEFMMWNRVLSKEEINLLFNDFYQVPIGNITYNGCSGNGYSIIVNNNLYDEFNPIGQEILECDSIINIQLNFFDSFRDTVFNIGCMNFEVEINGTIYNEQNLEGEEIFTSETGCDSIIYFVFEVIEIEDTEVLYNGCKGDDYQIEVNGNIYDELNPVGVEIIPSQMNCDSVVFITLDFEELIEQWINYVGCSGDGYQIEFNGTVFNEFNPVGAVLIESSIGCDSLFNIELQFNNQAEVDIFHEGCSGDGFEIEFNGIFYNESNPTGSILLSSEEGCDTLVNIDLNFSELIENNISYNGCVNDGYQIVLNGVIYDELNSFGQELSTGGLCDTLFIINLDFFESSDTIISFQACKGDSLEFIVGNNTFNEYNPNGQLFLLNQYGCDSIITVNLEYISESDCDIYIPNIISSSSSVGNDRFEVFIEKQCNLEILECMIFDRWGNQIFWTESDFSWFPRLRETELIEGVYAYKITFKNFCSVFHKTGSLTIVK